MNQENDLGYVVSISPVVNVSEETIYTIRRGARSATYYEAQAQSNSTNNIAWNETLGFANSALSRDMYMEFEAVVPVNKIVNGDPILTGAGNSELPNTFGMRQWPVNNTADSLNLKLNGASINTEDNSVVPLSHFYLDEKDQRRELSITPSMRDYLPDYTSNPASQLNPFLSYIDSDLSHIPRNASVEITAVDNNIGNPTGSFTIKWYEKVLLNGLNYDVSHDNKGLVGITELEIRYTVGNPLRWFAGDLGAINASSLGAITFNQKPKLYYEYYQIPQDVITIPRMIAYKYPKLQSLVTDFGNSVDGASFNQTTNSFSLSSVPSHILVWVQKRRSDKDISDTDSYCTINSITLSLGSEQNQLAGASKQQLFKINSKNGYSSSWPQFNSYGAVMRLDMAEDLETAYGMAPGQFFNGSASLQIRVQGVNTLGQTCNLECFMMVQFDGLLYTYPSPSGGPADIQPIESPLGNRSDLFDDLRSLHKISYAVTRADDLLGGGFKKVFANVAKKVAKVAPEILDFTADLGIPGVSQAARVAEVPANIARKAILDNGGKRAPSRALARRRR